MSMHHHSSDQHLYISIWIRCLGIVSYIHTQLGDYQQEGWGFVYWCSSFLSICLCFMPLQTRPYHKNFHPYYYLVPLAFMSTKLYTLYFLRDVLTQSFLLSFYHGFTCILLYRPQLIIPMIQSVRFLAAGTYFLAVIHKLNSTFIWHENSCALHGIDLTLNLLSLQWMWPWFEMIPIYVWSIFVLSLEFLLGYFCWKKSHHIWWVACLFHLPLTLTIAPAFASVMYLGYIGSLTPAMINQYLKWKTKVCTHINIYYLYILLLTGLSFTDTANFIKALMMLSLLYVAYISDASSRTIIIPNHNYDKAIWQPHASNHSIKILGKVFPIFSIFYFMHGFSPYIGLEYQHSAAMLSNLRIDPPCHNSLLFPSLKADPYVYIHQASFGIRERIKRKRILYEGVWNWTALTQMKKNWCIPEHRPLSMSIEWKDQQWDIKDLCANHSLHHLPVNFLPGWQRFQKNLTRHCNDQCIH